MNRSMKENTKHRVRLSKVLLNLILSAAIIFGSMPCKPFVMEVKADTPAEKTITGLGLGTIMTKPNEPKEWESWSGSHVYFGKYAGKPMKYRVLACSENMILLDCDNILKDIQFSANNNTSWKESGVRSWLQGNDFYNNTDVFTVAEKNAIHAGNKEIEGINDGIIPEGYTIAALEDPDPVFVLNVSAVTNSRLGYYNGTDWSNTREKYFFDETASKKVDWWWLRSKGDDVDWPNSVGTVYENGNVKALSAIDGWVGVSPALYLDTAPILYASLVNGSEGQAGSEYKLTLKDEGLSVSYNNVEGEDDRISVSYTFEDKSGSADPTQISVVVTDKAWDDETKLNEINVIQFTKLAMDSFGSSGTGTFTLNSNASGTWGEDYHIYILAEDVNGTYETDYASEPVELELKPSVQASAEDVEVTYDGNPHGISVNIAGDTEGVTVKYGSRADDCTKELGDLAITNVSDSPREIFYKASKQGYRSASGSATVKINKAKLIVSALDSVINYGEEPQPSNPPVRYGIKDNYGNVQGGFVNGENESVLGGELGFDYTYKQYDDTGKYWITPKGLTSDNYDIQFKPGRLRVDKTIHPDVNVSGNAAYGTEGILELKDRIEAGGSLGEVSIEGEEAILDGHPVTDGTRLRFKFKNDPGNVGKKVKLTIPVRNPKNYGDYNIIAGLEVISCDHSNKKLVEGTSIPGTCTQEGYEGDYRCPDCGAVIRGKNTPIDPENHDFAAVEVVKPATIITKGETKYRCTRCHTEKIVADIPCVEEGEEKDYDDLRKDVEGLSGNDAPKIEEKKDENGNTIEETVTIGGEEISKTVTDPESGKETIVSKVWIAGLEKTYTYTGSAIKPQVRVYDGTRKLTEKIDYTLSCKNNKEVGTDAQIIIKFKGSYSSSESKTEGFEIVKAELGKDILALDTATADEKKVKKTQPSLVWAETGKSVSSKFFDFEYGEVSGKECTVTIRPKTNYSGTYDKETTAKVRIVSDQNLLISKAKITFNPKSYAYTGKEITPSYKVTIGNTTLVKDTDFTETVQNGINPGTATLLIEAKPGNSKGYAGSKKVTFRIKGSRAINDNADIRFDVSSSVPFAKGGARASVRITDGTTVLKEGVDYTLSYSKNKSVTNGETAVVKIKGKGNYKGSVTEKFAVTKQQLSNLSEGVIIADQFTTRDKLKAPSVTITDLDGKNLSSSKDFEIENIDKDDSANTDESGTVRVTIKGKEGGAYEGRVDKTFRYMKAEANIVKAKMTKKIADQTYTGYPVKLSNEDLTGVLSVGDTVLVPGKDFIIDRNSYLNNNKKGTAKVTLIGTGAMAGRKTVTFKIIHRTVDYSGAITSIRGRFFD